MKERLAPVDDSFFLEEFFSEDLYLIKPRQKGRLEASPALQIKGTFTKKVMLVSREAVAENSPETGLINKILEAVGLTWKDVLLLHGTGQMDLKALETEYAPRLLLAFGGKNTISNWPPEAKNGELFNKDRSYYLASLALTELLTNREQKVLLWKSLKALFKIT